MNYFDKKRAEKPRKKRIKLKKWQIISIIIASVLFVIATTILIVMFYKAIFNESILAMSCLIVLLGLTIICLLLPKFFDNNKKY